MQPHVLLDVQYPLEAEAEAGWILGGLMLCLMLCILELFCCICRKQQIEVSKDIHVEDITCPRVDMNFIFEWSTPYLTHSLRSLVRYQVEHKKIKFISISGHVIFCLLYKHTYDDVIDYFLKISDHFPEISKDFPKFVRRPDKRFRTFSEHFPKISEDCRRLLRKNR